jgi:hypothetical protein
VTTRFTFTPSPLQPFQFQPTLDGSVYIATVTWNLAGQRWFITISTLTGNRVLTRAMVGSPAGFDINLVWGYFSSSLVWRKPSNQFEVSP